MNTITLWDTVDFETKHEESYVEFPYDPLAAVCACIRMGKEIYEFAHTLEIVNTFPTDLAILQEDIELAKKIRRHFANRQLTYLMKKDPRQTPSEYRKKLSCVLENDRRVNKDHFRVLITLPKFYHEEKTTLKLFENFHSLDEKYLTGDVVTIDNVYEYVGKISRYSSKTKSTRYYFCDRKKQLLMKEISNSDTGKNLMDYIVSNEKLLNIQGTAIARPQTSFDFRLFYLNNFELLQK